MRARSLPYPPAHTRTHTTYARNHTTTSPHPFSPPKKIFARISNSVPKPREGHAHVFSGTTLRVASLKLRDESGSIVLSAWGAYADSLDFLQEGQLVQVNDASVRTCKTGAGGASYELVLTKDEQNVIPYYGDVAIAVNLRVPIRQDHLPIGKLSQHMGKVVNVLAYVQERSPLFRAPKGGGSERQTFVLADETGSVSLILWGEDAIHYSHRLVDGSVAFFEAVKVETYREKLQVCVCVFFLLLPSSTLTIFLCSAPMYSCI